MREAFLVFLLFCLLVCFLAFDFWLCISSRGECLFVCRFAKWEFFQFCVVALLASACRQFSREPNWRNLPRELSKTPSQSTLRFRRFVQLNLQVRRRTALRKLGLRQSLSIHQSVITDRLWPCKRANLRRIDFMQSLVYTTRAQTTPKKQQPTNPKSNADRRTAGRLALRCLQLNCKFRIDTKATLFAYCFCVATLQLKND